MLATEETTVPMLTLVSQDLQFQALHFKIPTDQVTRQVNMHIFNRVLAVMKSLLCIPSKTALKAQTK